MMLVRSGDNQIPGLMTLGTINLLVINGDRLTNYLKMLAVQTVIPIGSAGNYTIELDLNSSPYTYTIIQN
ncbi:hypothetical protein [Fodinibius sp.]|uniref:hypothetical protein n=1 Tax=Fodinibius sp. TaxID=1872440 RepID=UPI002ACDF9C4|nr:hypothetical protein [Fodinibius sp.]MDZ7660090.1 hypothetical protein [Fodinibius sp.]